MIGQIIVGRLSTDATVTDVGGNRVYPLLSPQTGKQYPQIIYQTEKADPDLTYAGPSGLITQEVMISALAKKYSDMDALGNAIFDAFNGTDSREGTDGEWGGFVVQGAFYLGESENRDAFYEVGIESGVFIRSMLFQIVFCQN